MAMTEVCMTGDIVRETEKAICIDYCRERIIWIPKSVVMFDQGIVWVQCWFAKKHGIGRYGARRYIVG